VPVYQHLYPYPLFPSLFVLLFSHQPADEVTAFAELILPVPVPRLFTYRVPRNLAEAIKIGARVIVPFGKNNGRVLTAIVAELHTTPPTTYQARYILELLDEFPLVTHWQLQLFRWMADYYLCGIGEVMNVALPSGLKISSQSKVQYNPDFEHPDLLTDAEVRLLDELKKQAALSYEELGRIVGETAVPGLIKSLVGKRAVIVFEEVRERYTPKMIRRVRLAPQYETREGLLALIRQLDKSPKQQEVVMRYLSHVPIQHNPT
jgi:primosomal protein N' (replication factor Y) (superfamily II helicase)